MKMNPNTHFYLYAKFWYKREDVMEDLKTILAYTVGTPRYCFSSKSFHEINSSRLPSIVLTSAPCLLLLIIRTNILSTLFLRLISWKDFEENFIATEDKFIYELKITPEMEREAAKMYERMTWLAKQAFHIFRITNPNPPTPLTIQDLALLGSIVRKYEETFTGKSMIDFLEDVKYLRKQFSIGE